VANIIHNPVYVGLAGFPPLIDDGTWISAQNRVIQETGAELTLQHIRSSLERSVGSQVICMSSPEWIAESVQAMKAQGARQFFRQLLSELREELGR
jgi:hypothetical protein